MAVNTPAAAPAQESARSAQDSLSARIVELRCEARYGEAAAAARWLLENLRRDPDVRAWRIDDAVRLVETLEFVCGLPDDAQQELAGADRLGADMSECMREGKLREGIRLSEQQHKIRAKHFGEQHPETVESVYKHGGFRLESGDYANARRLLEFTLKAREALLGVEHPDVAASLNKLAVVFMKIGDYQGSHHLYTRALRIREKVLGPEHSDVGISLNNLALLLDEVGDQAGARLHYERALAIWEKGLGSDHPWVAVCLHNLADVLRRTGDCERARPMFERVLAIWEGSLGSEHPWVAVCMNNLAKLHEETEDFDTARILFERSLAIREKTLGPDHPDVAKTLINVAMFNEKTGDFANARSVYEKSLAIREKTLGPEHPLVAESLQKLSRLLLRTGQAAHAEDLLSRASKIFEVARLRAGMGFVRATFQASPYSELAIARLVLGRTDDAWPAAERALGRALADLLITSGQRSLEPWEAAREDSLREVLGELESRLIALQESVRADSTGEASRSFDKSRTQLLDAEVAWSILQREIAARHPVTEGQAFPLSRIQRSLAPCAALIGWVNADMELGGDDCWGYIIRKSGPVRWVRLGEARRTEGGTSPLEKVRRFRESLLVAASWRERVTEVHGITAYAQDLWDDWVAPLVPHLGGVEEVVIIPSGPVLGVPLEALPDSAGVYLSDRYAVSYIPSATIYTWLREMRMEERKYPRRFALLLGDPPYTGEQLSMMKLEELSGEVAMIHVEENAIVEPNLLRGALTGNEEALSGLQRLPWTREEVTRIAAVMKEGTVLLGPDASEQHLISLARSGRIREFDTIHLATHALVDDLAPERSALILSRVDLPDPVESMITGERVYDGLLTAKEIVREWVLDADLVTLSGCQTGLGKEVAGEGYIGLAHAFLQAGARSLVVSLWRVEDMATALLMTRFYENLTGIYPDGRNGRTGEPMTKAEALREAKHWLRTYRDVDGSRPFQHPVYWSGFVLIGDPE